VGDGDPSRAFGYFSLVAATNVLAVRLSLDDQSPATLVLGAASVPLWIVLTYAVLGAMVVGGGMGRCCPGQRQLVPVGGEHPVALGDGSDGGGLDPRASRRRWLRWRWRCGASAW
jgi:hypothetical protein